MLAPLTDVFEIRYGNQFDLSKMDACSKDDADSVAFVGRSAANAGVVAYVREVDGYKPFDAGAITVAMGGSILASFVQQRNFYTAQNVKVLTPKDELTLNELIFYCLAIESNKFRYTAFGREANSTFNSIQVPIPAKIPEEIKNFKASNPISFHPAIKKKIMLESNNWAWFLYSDLFDIYTSKDGNLIDANAGHTPYISSTQMQNGIRDWIGVEASHEANTITVARNGSVGSAFYQPNAYCASPDDIRIFKPKFTLNKYIGIFLITLIEKEKYRYAYGRKFGTKRMKDSKIKLPIDSQGKPDWVFMENYIKSLPYSSNL